MLYYTLYESSNIHAWSALYEPRTFMLDITLYGMNYIHVPCNITCFTQHSCALWHYMRVITFINIPYTRGLIKLSACVGFHSMTNHTFMIGYALHVRSNIHACTYITWLHSHSCQYLHYMVLVTFMGFITLHASAYIHALGNIICAILHSCIALHYMNGTTFMLLVTLHGYHYIHAPPYIIWTNEHSWL